MYNPSDAPFPGQTPVPVDERLARLEQAVLVGNERVERTLEARLNRLEHQVNQLLKLQSEHHFVLQEAMSTAPAVNRQLGDLYRGIAERMNMEHQHLQLARQQTAQELQGLSQAAAEVRQLVNESLPATQEASAKAVENLALLANDVKVERGALKDTIEQAMHESTDGQNRLVIITVVGAALVSSFITLCGSIILRTYGIIN